MEGPEAPINHIHFYLECDETTGRIPILNHWIISN
jgi:hypothetical protein